MSIAADTTLHCIISFEAGRIKYISTFSTENDIKLVIKEYPQQTVQHLFSWI